MQVNEVLEKITDRNTPVVGCIARNGDRLYHNLEGMGMDCAKIADTMDDLLNVSDFLEGCGEASMDTVLAEYDGNCLIGQRVDDSLLVTVSDHLHRAGFKKLQVGLSLQSRMLTKAMAETPAPEMAPAPSPEPAPVAETAPQPAAPAAKSGSTWAKLVNAVVASAPTEPAEQAAPEVNAEGKKRRVYRGQVYYE